jgi:glycosyltransferase involved in cell wall biosynthesis
MWPVSTIKKLIYIANARLPTENAHGFQIVKMCEAFVQNGVQVVLMHPFRYQPDLLKGQSIFEYYSVPSVFETRTLSNIDVIRIERLFPRVVFTPLFFIHALLWGLHAALKAQREGADLFYTRDAAIAYWLLRLNLPTIYEAHVVPKRGQRLLLKNFVANPSLKLVVVLTGFIKERFVEIGFSPDRVAVFSDGADLSLFSQLPSTLECRRRLGLPEDRPIIGYIGRFRTMEMEKGIPELIQAMAYVRFINEKEPLLLCVGGPMDPVRVYVEIARRCGVLESSLRFVDRVPNREVPLWTRACDLVTIPWRWNEFSAYFTSPLKLFEYMAAGATIIASDLPSIREVVRHGENAWLVEPENLTELGKGIKYLLQNGSLKKSLSDQARKSAEKYSWRQRACGILSHVSAAK